MVKRKNLKWKKTELRICPKCGRKLPVDIDYCPNCGEVSPRIIKKLKSVV